MACPLVWGGILAQVDILIPRTQQGITCSLVDWLHFQIQSTNQHLCPVGVHTEKEADPTEGMRAWPPGKFILGQPMGSSIQPQRATLVYERCH